MRKNIHDADHIGVYLTYKDLWPTREVTNKSLDNLLKPVDSKHLVSHLCLAGILLWKTDLTIASQRELDMLPYFFDDVSVRKIRLWIESGYRAKVVPRHCRLATIQSAMLAEGSNDGKPITKLNQDVIGNAVLMTANLLENDVEANRNIITYAEMSDIEKRKLSSQLFRMMSFQLSQDFDFLLTRNWAILVPGFNEVNKRSGKTGFNINEFMHLNFGFGLEHILGVGVAFFGKYDQFGTKNTKNTKNLSDFYIPRSYFRDAPNISQDSIAKLFAHLSLTWESHCERARTQKHQNPNNRYDLQQFYNYPLLEETSENYVPLDLQFLVERVTEGVFWIIHDELRRQSDAKGLDRFKDAFSLSTEWYVTSLLDNCIAKRDDIRMWSDFEGTIDTKGNSSKPDICVFDSGKLYFIELTTISIPPSIRNTGDHTIIEDGLRRIWYGRDPSSRGKIGQLISSIYGFREGRLILDGIDKESVKECVPVLLSLRQLPVNAFMRWWYDYIRDTSYEGNGNQVLGDVMDKLLFMSVSDFEFVCLRLYRGSSLNELIQSYQDEAAQISPNIRGKLLGKYRIANIPIIERWRDELFDSTTMALFGKRYSEIERG